MFFYIDVSAISYHWRSYTPVDELGPTVHIFSGYYRQSIDLTVRTSPLPVIAICIWYFFYAMLQCLSIILSVRYDFGWLVELFIIYTNTILDTNAELSIFYLHDVSPWSCFGWLVELFIISVVWYTNTILDTNVELSIFYLHDVSPW